MSRRQAGNEAVLRARFEDAKFFYEDDLAKPLADFRPLLAGTVFHKQLGTLLDKSVRRGADARQCVALPVLHTCAHQEHRHGIETAMQVHLAHVWQKWITERIH